MYYLRMNFGRFELNMNRAYDLATKEEKCRS
jgi:hypothetical protein